ncbi:GerAB/ArcD/ProY family transporter [Roseburia sp. 831b]|uniref:GerAB/ArcD/ProY family transporter n=1 Tax=Roseburia sp. 831b TaxID=1261635 RepID=UPI000952A382|nr:GerAB/ArcD/ProY family transporter [Roseburia sp. 831b]WVK73227.1 GerAB/ArcD/ProY family transporter [Roseburia sp. 831b]
MFSENKKISGRQIFRLLTYDLLGIGTLLLPTILAKTTGADGVFSIFVGLGIGGCYLVVLGFLLKKMEGDFYEFLRKKCGCFVQKIVLSFFVVYFCLLAGYTAYLTSCLVLTHLLQQGSFLLVLLLLLLLAGYGNVAGIEGRARVYEMLFWFLMLPFFLMLFFGAKDVQTAYWTPVFMGDAGSFWKGTYAVVIWASLLVLLLFLPPFAKKQTILVVNTKRAFLFSGGILLVLYLILLGTFGANALAHMENPAVVLMSTVQMTGGFLKRVDAFMLGMWFFMLYALLNSLLFYGKETLGKIFEKNRAGADVSQEGMHENGKGGYGLCNLISTWSILIITFVVAICFYRSKNFSEWYHWFLWWVGTPVLLVMPVLLLPGAGKGEQKR